MNEPENKEHTQETFPKHEMEQEQEQELVVKEQEPSAPTTTIPYIQDDMSDIWNFVSHTLEVQYPPHFGFDQHYMENQMNHARELWENQFVNDFPWNWVQDIASDTIGITTANPIWNTLRGAQKKNNFKNRISRQLQLIHRWDAKIPRQRTPEWQERRYNMITASEVHSILGESENTWKGCLRSKLRGYREFINAQQNPSTNPPISSSPGSLDWGVCFEPVVTDMIYPQLRGDCVVGEFGCIEHPRMPGLGASPDGIVVGGPTKYVGRMVEIKCPTTRAYDPYKIKYEYWVQMQIQMEVCDLEECDFIECWFKEMERGDWLREPEDGRTKGVAYRMASPEGSCWFHKKDDLPSGAVVTEKRQWVLDRMSCRLVKRNREWFLSVREQIQEFIDELHSIHKHGDFSMETMELIDEECRKVSGRTKKIKASAPQKLSGFAFRNV